MIPNLQCIYRQRCLTECVSGRMVNFSKESEIYLEKYAVSEKFPERFEIKIPIT